MSDTLEQKIEIACGGSKPSAGHDWADEIIGLLNVTRGQRDGAVEEVMNLTKRLRALELRAEELEKKLREAQAAHDKVTAMISRYLVASKGHVSDSWMDAFIECGAVTIDMNYPTRLIAPIALNDLDQRPVENKEKCIKCGCDAGFPALVTEPYTCLTCLIPKQPETVATSEAKPGSPHPDGSSDWVYWNKGLVDGVYLTKSDEHDEDANADTYHVRTGKFYKPTGEQWVCYGGVWKRIGNLTNDELESADKRFLK